jgi:hypothetical protein
MAGGSEGVEEEDNVAFTAGTSEIKSDRMSVSAIVFFS